MGEAEPVGDERLDVDSSGVRPEAKTTQKQTRRKKQGPRGHVRKSNTVGTRAQKAAHKRGNDRVEERERAKPQRGGGGGELE